MSVLQDLLAKREAAKGDYDYVSAAYRAEAEAGDPTPESETAYADARAAVEALDARIIEVDGQERREAAVTAARARIEEAAPAVSHIKEPRTYGPGSENSYFADFVRASNQMWPGHQEALRRLDDWAAEVAGEMRDPNSKEGARARLVVADHRRESQGSVAREAIDRAASYVKSEMRTGMDTTAGSGGSFVTPQYFVSDYAAYRQYGREFIDQSNKQDLPSYGMTIYMPHLSGPAGVSAQGSQNSGVTETDPTAGYLSTNLTTNAGEVTISQQLLDRAGPNFAFDKMVFDQLDRAYNLTVDAYVLTQALANANSVTSSYSSFTPQTFLQKIAGAKAAMADTAGTVLPATHVFSRVDTWEYITAQVDSTSGRPAFVENANGPWNAFGAGTEAQVAEGDSGYRLKGLPVFTDQNIPQDASSHNQVIVAHMPEVWVWEGDLVPRVIPQTFAQNLSVLLQVYAYVGCIARYQNAVQTVSGSALNVTF